MSDPAESPRRLGCGGHIALFLLAGMATWVAVFRAAARDAAAAGRAMTPDSMGLLWPLLVPFVYLGLLALAVVGLAIFNAVRRARHNRSPGP